MNDPDLYEWMALQRVDRGGMAKSAGNYFDDGRPIPDYLVPAFDYIIRRGWVIVATGDPLWEMRRMTLTDAGRVRYEELSAQQQQQQRRRPRIEAPPPEHGPRTSEGHL